MLSGRGALAQSTSSFDELGRLYVRNFGPEDYDSDPVNWAVVQSPDGLVYVANGDGVLEYDGVSWRLISISGRTAARSLAIGGEGQVFVGGIDQLGYLAPDSAGLMRFVSLVDHIAPEDRELGNVWNIEKTSDGVYFQTTFRLLRWNGQEMKVWRAEERFGRIFALRDVFYVQQEGIGLMRMDDGSLSLAPGGTLFQDERIYGLVPRGGAANLVVTRNQGMFRCPTAFGKTACSPFSPGLTDLLVALQPYRVNVVGDGILAIATRQGGVVLLDRAGRLLRILNEASGLRDESVDYSHVDRQGGLWLGLNNGLARVEIGASLSYWDKSSGLTGIVKDVTRHQGRLYAATSLGVCSLASASEGVAPRFLPCPGIAAQCWGLLSTPQGLLAGCQGGLYNVDDQQLILPLSGGHALEVVRSSRDPTLLYLGLLDGLAWLRFQAGRWTEVGRLHSQTALSLVEDAQGRLWVGADAGGVHRVEAALSVDPASRDPVSRDPVSRDLVVTRFGVADGLPVGSKRTKIVAGGVTVLGDGGAGLFRLDAEADSVRFVRTHYRVRLDGLDSDWSAWIDEPHKDYTNLWEGRYVFRAQARDVYGLVSREDTFAFRILPPWYRSWWAFGLYGLAFAAAVLIYVRRHRRQLRRERAINARLREVDELKDEFLANTSHELRTPGFEWRAGAWPARGRDLRPGAARRHDAQGLGLRGVPRLA